jgi:hypothetical protein
MNPVNFVDPMGERLIINPNDKNAVQYFEYLTKLSDDQITMDENGEIFITKEQKGQRKFGTMLLKLLIAAKKIVTIYSTYQVTQEGYDVIQPNGTKKHYKRSELTPNSNQPLDLRHRSDGNGSDTLVNITGMPVENFVFHDTVTSKNIENGIEYPLFMLSHELIHALHTLYGIIIPQKYIGKRKYLEGKYPNRAPIEEFVTVGLLEGLQIEGEEGKIKNVMVDFLRPLLRSYGINEDIFYEITENAIRREQNDRYIRIKY